MKTALLALATFALLLASGPAAEAQLAVARVAPSARLVTTSPAITSFSRNRVVATSTTSAPNYATSTRAVVAPAPAQPGQLVCLALDTGVSSAASLRLESADGRTDRTVDCASPVSVPAGDYNATITLLTALDRPTQTVRVTVPSGGVATATARFTTAILEVRFTSNGLDSYGRAIVRRNGVELGSLGSGIVGRVSAGTYEIVAQHRTEERSYTVVLTEGQRRAVAARF